MIRFILLLNLLLFFISSYSQGAKQFVLHGKLEGRDTGRITLIYSVEKNKIVKDTTYLQKGHFLFSGNIFQPTSSSIVGSPTKGNIAYFFLEPGEQNIDLEENNFLGFRMAGSFTQKQNDTLNSQIKSIELVNEEWLAKKDSLLIELKNSNDTMFQGQVKNRLLEFDDRIHKLNNKRLSAMVTFISDHPDSYVSPTSLYGILVSNRLNTETVNDLFLKFSDRIKNSSLGILISEEINRRSINTRVPDFTTKDIHDKQVSLSGFKGKHVLINFWASWCVPCINKMPELKRLLLSYQFKGFEIVNISIDVKKANWIRAVKKYELEKFQNIITNKEIDSKFPNTKMPIPSEILIGPSGRVVWTSMNLNPKSLSETLKEAFIE